jgi:hypothetical protein
VCTTLRNMAIPRDASRRLPDSMYCRKTPTFGFKTPALTSLASSRPVLDAVHRSLGQYSALKPTQFHGRSVGTNMVLLKVSSSSGIKMNASPCRKEGIKGSGSNESLRRHRPPRYLRNNHLPRSQTASS